MVQTQAVVSNGSYLVDTVDRAESLAKGWAGFECCGCGCRCGVEGDLDAKRQRSYIVVSHDRDACYYYD